MPGQAAEIDPTCHLSAHHRQSRHRHQARSPQNASVKLVERMVWTGPKTFHVAAVNSAETAARFWNANSSAVTSHRAAVAEKEVGPSAARDAVLSELAAGGACSGGRQAHPTPPAVTRPVDSRTMTAHFRWHGQQEDHQRVSTLIAPKSRSQRKAILDALAAGRNPKKTVFPKPQKSHPCSLGTNSLARIQSSKPAHGGRILGTWDSPVTAVIIRRV